MKGGMIISNLHRNSQKRFYGKDKIYFITTVTEQRFPYFKEGLFCELFLENLKICKRLKEFLLYGFINIPDHAHLLVKPDGKYNISEIMQFLKRHISRDLNFILGANNEGEIRESRLQEGGYKNFQGVINEHDKLLKEIKFKFINKYGSPQFDIPKFKWQQSSHDHVIRN